MQVSWTDDDLRVEKLALEPTWDFICSRKEQADYFLQHAWQDQEFGLSVTYLLFVKEELAGYVTVTMDEIPLALHEREDGVRFSRVPAMKIAQMAVQKQFAGNGFGKFLVTFAILTATEVKEKIGCRYVTLDAKTDLVKWYEHQGFVVNEKDQAERIEQLKSAPIKQEKKEKRMEILPVSMRFDLHSS